MMLIQGDGQVYFADRDNSIFEVKGLTFPHVKDTKRILRDTLLDGVSFIINADFYINYKLEIKFYIQKVAYLCSQNSKPFF